MNMEHREKDQSDKEQFWKYLSEKNKNQKQDNSKKEIETGRFRKGNI